MQKAQLVGAVILIFGLAVLVVLGSFILGVIVFLLQLLAVIIGIIMVVAGIALLVGRRWMKRGPWELGSPPAST